MTKSRSTTKSRSLPKLLTIAVLAAGAGLAVWQLSKPSAVDTRVEVRVPDLSRLATEGKRAFDANCARCHGPNGAGSAKGPPLVHKIYNPGHHADAAFFAAARRGAPQHHWRFGNMPPQPQVSDDQLLAIVRYIRELQEANGIFYEPHTM